MTTSLNILKAGRNFTIIRVTKTTKSFSTATLLSALGSNSESSRSAILHWPFAEKTDGPDLRSGITLSRIAR